MTCKTYEELENQIKTYITKEESLDKIRKAYKKAEILHEGQVRKSGEPYIIHPFAQTLISE